MMFDNLPQKREGQTNNPFSNPKGNDEGEISIEFLNKHFGQYSTAEEMINATDSEGLKKFFQWLKDEGKLD